jgi:hypothetical protein
MDDKPISPRPTSDDYPTPPECTRALMSREAFGGPIWEPCAGEGVMADALREKHKVFATTYQDTDPRFDAFTSVLGGVDFLEQTTLRGSSIVTNPPYGYLYGKRDAQAAEKIIWHAISLKPTKLDCFLNLKFMASVRRKNGLFMQHPPARIYIFSDRPSLYPSGWEGKRTPTTETFAWFVWDWPFIPCGTKIAGLFDSKDFRKEST